MKRYSADHFCSGWAWLVVVIALFPRPGGGAVQSLVSERRSFERGVEYQYVYKSKSAIHGNIGIEIDTKVRLSLVKDSSDGDQEIRVQCDPTTVQWTSDNGDATTDGDTFKDLSKWFSVSLSSSGHVTSVHYPSHERHTILAFKKTIASLISFEQYCRHNNYNRSLEPCAVVVHDKKNYSSFNILCVYHGQSTISISIVEGDDVTRGVVNDVIQLNWTHTQQHNHYKKVVTKSLLHNTKQGLINAHLLEVATPTRTTPSSWSMFSNNMTSTSDFRLIKTHPLESGDNHMIGEDLVTDTLEITEHLTYYPLSELEPEILRLLSCNHGNITVCHQSLSHLIGQLSHDDLDDLMNQHIEMDTHLLSLVDSMALSSSPYSTLILTKLLSPTLTIPQLTTTPESALPLHHHTTIRRGSSL